MHKGIACAHALVRGCEHQPGGCRKHGHAMRHKASHGSVVAGPGGQDLGISTLGARICSLVGFLLVEA